MRLPLVFTCLAALLVGVGCAGAEAEPRTAYSANPQPRPGAQAYPAQRSYEEVAVASKPDGAFASDVSEDAPKKANSAPAESPPSSTPAPAAPPAPSAPSGGATTKSEREVEKARQSAAGPENRDFVIYTARFTMAVYQVDQGLTAVEKIARDNGGYLGQRKDREITVRVPRARFEPTLAAVDKIGDVLHRDIAADDVTDEHVDVEIRIKNARAMQRRLTELLGRADVKNALEIEKELHRVTEELERLEGHLKVLNDKIAFSTITVAFEARGTTIQTARVRLPFPWLGAMNLPSLLSLSEDK
jgi:hypothetical protein